MCFQGHWKEIVGPAERAVLCCLPDSCSLSGTGTGDGALLEIGVPQSVDYCDVPSGAASGVPRQQCQTIGALAVVPNRTWFFHAGDAGSGQRTPDDVVYVVVTLYSAGASLARESVSAQGVDGDTTPASMSLTKSAVYLFIDRSVESSVDWCVFEGCR